MQREREGVGRCAAQMYPRFQQVTMLVSMRSMRRSTEIIRLQVVVQQCSETVCSEQWCSEQWCSVLLTLNSEQIVEIVDSFGGNS